MAEAGALRTTVKCSDSWSVFASCHNPQNPTKGRTYGLIICSNVVILFNYTMISIFGYLSFCGETQDNILANLPDLPYVVVARFMLVIQVWCGKMRVNGATAGGEEASG